MVGAAGIPRLQAGEDVNTIKTTPMEENELFELFLETMPEGPARLLARWYGNLTPRLTQLEAAQMAEQWVGYENVIEAADDLGWVPDHDLEEHEIERDAAEFLQANYPQVFIEPNAVAVMLHGKDIA